MHRRSHKSPSQIGSSVAGISPIHMQPGSARARPNPHAAQLDAKIKESERRTQELTEQTMLMRTRQLISAGQIREYSAVL